MKNETTVTLPLPLDALVLEAAIRLDREMLEDEGFAGYDGDMDQFVELQTELYAILENVSGVDSLESLVDTFYLFQNEIVIGAREVCWFNNL
jgi:hypothetical protein